MGMTRPTPYNTPKFEKGKPIYASSMTRLANEVERLRKEPIQLAMAKRYGTVIKKPTNPKTLHPSAVDRETIDTDTEVEWDYETWLTATYAANPEYFSNATTKYDGYKVWIPARPPVYSSAGDEILYRYYVEELRGPDGRVWNRSAVTRDAIATPEAC